MTQETVEFSHVYRGLKDFQLDTVEHVVERLYGDRATDRFLVADEVGLGKTLVARGVIARSIEHHLALGTDRIDVVYICSNADIAKQNVGRLNVLERNDFNLATRITLLPWILGDLQGNRINFVSFTPGTSFNLRSSEGIVRERVLLYHMLRDIWGSGVVRAYKVDQRVFAGGASFANFYGQVARFAAHGHYDESLGQRFATELERASARGGGLSLQDRFEALRDRFAPIRQNRASIVPKDLRSDRAAFIGELREILARTCVEALEPDLVILDEFQRFKHLFDDSDPAGELARHLFGYEDVKVLLLSATPYKMYTLSDEAGEDDHYADFLDTLRFLMGADEVGAFAQHLRRYRRGLFSLGDGSADAHTAKEQIETALREVMSRTERLAVTEDRSGMLSLRPSRDLRLEVGDVRQYVSMARLGEELDVGGMLEYWKSTPYPLSFMEGYALDREVDRLVDDGDLERLRPYADADGVSLSREELESYERIDPGNLRLRSLAADVITSGAWRLLWVPPSLPYYSLGGPYAHPDLGSFTKRLVFSAWKVVPKVIGAMLSYEVERRMMRAAGRPVRNTADARRNFTGLLRFQRSDGRLTGMPVFGLLYPSPALAELGDPRRVAAQLGGYDRPLSAELVLHDVRRRIADALRPHIDAAPVDGADDDRWYWAAALLLDRDRALDETTAWFDRADLHHRFRSLEAEGALEEDGDSIFADHVDVARRFFDGEAEPLGRVPNDLLDVVAELALAGPGVSALRALDRVNARGLDDGTTRDHAGYVAWGVRHLFNLMDVTNLLRSEASGRHQEDAYWRLALRYCFDGCFQSVLDEYVHVVHEWRGTTGVEGGALLAPISATIREALELRTVNYTVRHLEDGDDGRLELGRSRVRGLYALRFGDEKSDDEKSIQRSSSVRAAFNSPFRPFVLATTSIGQEGLDFHMYCHAVVHWNLPSNPVDLEQREGRVHRYKGHAVRRNVATDQRAAALGREPDPWTALFRAAEGARGNDDNELIPYWIYTTEGGAQIERYVPALPLSRGSRKLKQLQKSLAAYRLVFGQPRQEDLVAYLQERIDPTELRELLDELRIDVTPPRLGPLDRARVREPRPLVVEAPPGAEPTPQESSGPRITRRQQQYQEFWGDLLDQIRRQHPGWTTSHKPQPQSWIELPAGTSGIYYAIVFASNDRMRIELYVDPSREDLKETAWEWLRAQRGEIETSVGTALTWEDLPDRRASRLAWYHEGPASITREDEWATYRDWILARLGRFRDAVQPHVDRLVGS